MASQHVHDSVLAGYGDVRPVTSAERSYTILGMLIGASLYAYMVSCCRLMSHMEASMVVRAAIYKARAMDCDTFHDPQSFPKAPAIWVINAMCMVRVSAGWLSLEAGWAC